VEHANIRLGWKSLSDTNTQAFYDERLLIMDVKSFIKLSPRPNIIKVFTVVNYEFS
jgi:hypothetical protein